MQVIEMPEHNPGNLGGTMRLGKRRTIFTTEDSVLRKLYGNVEYVEERHRHRYEVTSVLFILYIILKCNNLYLYLNWQDPEWTSRQRVSCACVDCVVLKSGWIKIG